MSVSGAIAERYAANFLRRKKYQLIEYNYSTRFGEIDLIFTKGKYIIFVEVKSRDENAIAEPKEFVDSSKQKKIIATSQLYMSTHSVELQPRFDIIEVICSNDEILYAKHLENAFTLD